jgi:uncharacterized protein YjbI with pentapeptide repeats
MDLHGIDFTFADMVGANSRASIFAMPSWGVNLFGANLRSADPLAPISKAPAWRTRS